MMAIGDDQGEHLHAERGRYDAWIHVGIGFVYQILFVAATLGIVAGLGVGAAVNVVSDAHAAQTATYLTAGIVGLAGAYLVFRNRWRCIEAFSSRFCSGLANLSMLYVPIVAFCYANYRGVKKLSRQ